MGDNAPHSQARENDPALRLQRKSSDVYVDCLLTRVDGYPLWDPSPDRSLPALNRTRGVSLGDVGMLTPEGGFDFLFNIFYDAFHPINTVVGVPDGFFPFKPAPGAADIRHSVHSGTDSIFADASMLRLDDGRDRSITTLKATGIEGAVLILPENLHITKLKTTTRLRKYVAQNTTEWYIFVRNTLGHDIENGDLRVVYGCGKSSGFGLATAFNNGSAENTQLSFLVEGALTDNAQSPYRWTYTGSAECKTGPSRQDHVENSPAEPTRNQCLFVNTIDASVSAETWKGIVERDAVTNVMATSNPMEPDRSERGPTVASSTSSASGATTRTSSFPFYERAFHPSVILQDMLETITPGLSTYIVCDDDWAPFVSDTTLNTRDFIDHILERKIVVEDQGILFFCDSNNVELLEEIGQRGAAQISFTRISTIDSPSAIDYRRWKAERRAPLSIGRQVSVPTQSGANKTLSYTPAITIPSLLTKAQAQIRSVFRSTYKRSHAKVSDPPIITYPFTRANIPSMFSNAQNIHINNGSFTIVNNVNTVVDESPLRMLHRLVAPNAILNAGGRAGQVRCHPGTRMEVIGRVEQWANGQDGHTRPILWLSGPAGAGKSAIMQTIAERCNEHSVPQANFFFFQADSSRNMASPLIATLLHQIILLYPPLREYVATAFATNPLIFDSTMEDQLKELIVAPLHVVQQSSSTYRRVLVVIDGLDECESEVKRSQQQIIDAFDKVISHYGQSCPFRLLAASRDESHIQATFHRLSSPFEYLYLDHQWLPERDIRVYVKSQFRQVRMSHPLAHTLSPTWPSAADIDYIVEKSSGNFSYATTVMLFILESAESPVLSLQRVQGLAGYTTKSPFSHLDDIYSYILSCARNQNALKDILHAQLLKETPTAEEYALLEVSISPHNIPLPEILVLYDRKYTEDVVLSCLADLPSVAVYDHNCGGLLFHHKSFSDYLLDQSRSGEYFVDTATFNYRIMPVIWTYITKSPENQMMQQFGLYGLSQLLQLPPGLMDQLVLSQNVWSHLTPQQSSIFSSIRNLCCDDDDLRKFRIIFREWLDCRNLDDDEFIRDTRHIPFIQRYRQMDRAERFVLPDSDMKRALSPHFDSNVDRRESALWLSDLLHRVYREIFPHDTDRYHKLVKEWIAWAVWDEIPCDDLVDLPYARECYQRRVAAHHVTITTPLMRTLMR